MRPDEILCRCVLEHEKPLILAEAHSDTEGGHYAGKATAQKILTAGLWWPTIHKDAKEYATAAISVKGQENHPEGMRCP